MIKYGKIVKRTEGGVIAFVPFKDNEITKTARKIIVEISDSRKISMAQRRKAFVLLGYISAWWGYTPLEATKEITKQMFKGYIPYSFNTDFSLSDCSVEEARLYITYLIDFVFFMI